MINQKIKFMSSKNGLKKILLIINRNWAKTCQTQSLNLHNKYCKNRNIKNEIYIVTHIFKLKYLD